jgi:replicative DNA helicase
MVSGKPDLETFVEVIGAVGYYKTRSLSEIRQHLANSPSNTNRDVIPHTIWREHVVPAMRASGMATRQMMAGINTAYCGTGIYKQNVSRARADRIAQVVHSDALTKLAHSDVYWDEVVKIEPDGETDVYDLTIEKHHNFIVCNICSHNSLEQDSDLVAFLFREELYNKTPETEGKAEIILAKQRNGPTGTIELAFLREFTRFENLMENPL